MSHRFAAVLLAAGQGTRMKSDIPKVLHKIAGRSMIGHVAAALEPLAPEAQIIVHAPGGDGIAGTVAGGVAAEQSIPLGTGDALKSALPVLPDGLDTVLVLFGDTPFISSATLAKMLALRACADAPSVVVLGFDCPPPHMYGRLVLDAAQRLTRIVEARDASQTQLAISLCNSGIMAIAADRLQEWLGQIGNANAKGEFYMTDLVEIAVAAGAHCAAVSGLESEALGIDDRIALARAEAIMQDRLRRAALENGTTLVDPSSVTLSFDTEMGRDCVIHPQVVFGPGVKLADQVEIKPFSHLEASTVATGAVIGPFARLRGGADIGQNARVGNFVEVKNTRLHSGVKAGHLSYLGDAEIGAGANIGAGTITCNFDGVDKHRTTIGAGAFIGSNTALVAPLDIGADALVAAGSTISADVAPWALAITRAEVQVLGGAAKRFRARRQANKRKKLAEG
jgi:bifunctional UDP-N-acetylglucosamine pyrophosphorylase/glucosamine-1-phosphate N-acetyltransferase